MGEREDRVPGVNEHFSEILTWPSVDLGSALIITWEAQARKICDRNKGMLLKKSEISPSVQLLHAY